MEIQQIEPIYPMTEEIGSAGSNDQFIFANTVSISPNELRTKCIIPSFAKDNESTISHNHFIEAVMLATHSCFKGEAINEPLIRVSHPVKGRIPSAMGKAANLLKEEEKTLYYERMAFIIDVPSIKDTINGNELSLSIGGVRAYNLENLYSRKMEEKFKIFIGFKNRVCTNLCISTDGLVGDLKARAVAEIFEKAFELLNSFNAIKQIENLCSFGDYFLSETQFAQLLGKSRMYQYLPPKIKKGIPAIMPLSDSQISLLTKAYYQDKDFCVDNSGNISLWKLFNLFTGANKSSYIDTFLDRGVGSHSFVNDLKMALEGNSTQWFINNL